MLEFGLVGNSKSLGKPNSVENIGKAFSILDSKQIYARVLDIILDNTHPDFNSMGRWNSIGLIKFELLDNPITSNKTSWAYPLNPNIKNYPLKNEIILLFKAPNRDINEISNLTTYYYISSINLWNNSNHNAYPNPLDPSKLDLNGNGKNKTFIENPSLSELLPFAGDIIYNGRFGNSIRFGNTCKNNLNLWSSSGDNGDPITILTNTISKKSANWEPKVEDINNDLSSIYLTSTQKIDLKDLYNDYSSFLSPFIIPKEYTNSQIILRSNRLLLSSKEDGILINGKKFISINSNGEIGFNTLKPITFNTNKINLGDKNANQQLILGNKLLTQLSILTESLINVVEILEETLHEWPGGEKTAHPASIPLSIQKDNLNDILKVLNGDTLLSKISRTI